MCWRAGLRVGEALALAETDLDPSRGAILIRKGKGGKRREVGMDRFGWEHLDPWLERRRQLPVGALFLRPARPQPRPAVVAGRGPLRAAARRRQGRRAPALGSPSATPRARGRDGPRRRADGRHPAPARACPPRDHLHLFQGIDNAEIIDTVHRRAAPVIPASSRLRSPWRSDWTTHRTSQAQGRLPWRRSNRAAATGARSRAPAGVIAFLAPRHYPPRRRRRPLPSKAIVPRPHAALLRSRDRGSADGSSSGSPLAWKAVANLVQDPQPPTRPVLPAQRPFKPQARTEPPRSSVDPG